jgi:hypothetical protein
VEVKHKQEITLQRQEAMRIEGQWGDKEQFDLAQLEERKYVNPLLLVLLRQETPGKWAGTGELLDVRLPVGGVGREHNHRLLDFLVENAEQLWEGRAGKIPHS